ERDKVYFADEILEQLRGAFGPLVPAEEHDPSAPAQEYRYADGGGQVGIIASVSRPFCMSCNRIRLTADGKLRNCLFALQEVDVKAVLRGGGSDDDLIQIIRRNVHDKWERTRDQHGALCAAAPPHVCHWWLMDKERLPMPGVATVTVQELRQMLALSTLAAGRA